MLKANLSILSASVSIFQTGSALRPLSDATTGFTGLRAPAASLAKSAADDEGQDVTTFPLWLDSLPCAEYR